MRIRRKRKQAASPSVGALDAQSVKWGNLLSNNGFDANKKVKGIKRSIVVDRNGFILGRTVETASRHDSKLAPALCSLTAYTWKRLRKILVDRGYRGEVAENIKLDLQIEIEVCNTPDGTKGFTPRPLRWVVERTFA